MKQLSDYPEVCQHRGKVTREVCSGLCSKRTEMVQLYHCDKLNVECAPERTKKFTYCLVCEHAPWAELFNWG